MNQFIFKNRWFAAGFVAFTLLSTYLLVGDNENGFLSRMTGSVADRRQELNGQMAQVAAPPPAPLAAPPAQEVASEEHEYLDDEELIDSASGVDPTPPDEMAQSGADAGADGAAGAGDGAEGTAPGQRFEYVNGVAIIKPGH